MSSNPRAFKLNKLFNDVLKGSQNITASNAGLFLEALYNQPDAATCISKVTSSTTGLASLQSAMRCDLSPQFFNGSASHILTYLQAEELQSIGQGDFLNPVVLAITEPPIFWNPFCKAFQDGLLETKAQTSFAWLLLRLVSLPGKSSTVYRGQAKDLSLVEKLGESSSLGVRTLAQKVRTVLAPTTLDQSVSKPGEISPGGRHDNDFADFRDIVILPTADEAISTNVPFLRTSDAIDDIAEGRLQVHLDNQFRLLREDMMYEIKEELQIAMGKKKGRHRGMKLDGLIPIDLHSGEKTRRVKWGIQFKCKVDFPQFKNVEEKNRKKHLIENRNILRQGSLTVLLVDGEIVAFPVVNRDEDLLSKIPPIIVLQFEGQQSISRALLMFKANRNISLIQIDTAVFAYEPVLRALQRMTTLHIEQEFLYYQQTMVEDLPPQLKPIIYAVRQNYATDLQALLKTPKSMVLDESQAESLLAGLTQSVALIQGPPGTGKSFIGALLAKALHDTTSQIILVVCYTNHALDDVLTGLLDIGIPEKDMVRLGGKSVPRTESLSLYNQARQNVRRKGDWAQIDSLRAMAEGHLSRLEGAYKRYSSSKTTLEDVMNHLEFDAPEYFEAFQVPKEQDGMTQVGKKGKSVGPMYLIHQWTSGWDGGNYRNHPVVCDSPVWKLSRQSRQDLFEKWRSEILKDLIAEICEISKDYNDCLDRLSRKRGEDEIAILMSKRIIGCTTTAAAKYAEAIQGASPGILLVEEAAEILESHVLTAIGKGTKKVILIGDHKQLRPKVNNYRFTVEKGEGFDLNVSLFERLITKKFPHSTLSQQHRMRPEISTLIRRLTYPELVDAPGTKNRPDPEGNLKDVTERRDAGSLTSKQNMHEVQMVLKILRYLGQQGYVTEDLVILTPYLGQLSALRNALRKDNDPILNDLDSFDLIQAGLMTPATAKLIRKPIRLATIDNYQGEESDIVLVSLTRSNLEGDIGFMFSPERLNVLLSRARNALIMIGNLDTFKNARKGGELWRGLFSLLKEGNHVYDGLPIQCDRHPDRKGLVENPNEFNQKCPDGGCLEPCGATLNCGKHKCPSKCHQIADHSKMKCEHIEYTRCLNNHQQQWKCHAGIPLTCFRCEGDKKAAEKKQKEDFERQKREDAERAAHLGAFQEIEDKIAREREAIQSAHLAKEREDALRQKNKDLEDIKARAKKLAQRATATAPSPAASIPTQTKDAEPSQTSNPLSPMFGHIRSASATDPVSSPLENNPPELTPTPSEKEWKRRKGIEGVTNDAVDAIMGMTGLEEVKAKVLEIYDKVEVTRRQGTDVKRERFNIVFLGNPGTGKTTVARQYAQFLASLQVLPGSEFVETTGARMADDGVPATKKQIEEILKNGGGAIFVDEAYQLTAPHAYQGRQVLDFLLAEMENNVGRIVFILAGYNKEMEKFFEHNPGLSSRVPYKINFMDYNNKELLSMFASLLDKKSGGKMKVEGGVAGLFSRIVIARLGRQRGRPGFGNARALQNVFDRITGRQATRIAKERREGKGPDDFLLTKEDLIGREPPEALKDNPAWEKLQKLTGLASVKQSVKDLMGMIEANYWREMKEEEPLAVSLNRTFLGSPGTGKTTVAQLYGKILASMGLLSNGEVVIKNPAEFIGSALGESEANTKGILASTVGKVLVIDEAYMLHGGAGGANGSADSYKTAVIDTMVAEIQSVPGEDRCVILIGYKEEMECMFQHVNPGLARRFSIENAFNFQDFTDPELREILDFKLKDKHVAATKEAKDVAINVLSRLRARPNFGNAGEVENLISKAKENQQARTASLSAQERANVIFLPQDFDPQFDRGKDATANLAKLFEDIVGCEEILKRLEGYQKVALKAKEGGMDMRELIPTNFVFKGPPGTGKTTVARKMGQVYFDMGFLSSPEVVETSASDMVGQYVGQTGPKTKNLFKKACGRVLLIDEAYRLCEGTFAKESIDEVVTMLTAPEFKGKIIVILAGYDHDINRLLTVNAGLSSRFTEHIIFANMSSEHCLKALHRQLQKKSVHFPEVENPESEMYEAMKNLLDQLSELPSWGNARDVETLGRKMINAALVDDAPDRSPPGTIALRGELALKITSELLQERRGRSYTPPPVPSSQPPAQTQTLSPPPRIPPKITTAVTTTQKQSLEVKPPPKQRVQPKPATSSGRDPGVSDHVWNRLQKDKKEAEAAEKWALVAKREAERKLSELKRQEKEAQELLIKLKRQTVEAAAAEERKRQLEEARLERARLKAEREKAARELEEKKKAEEERRKKEAQVQAKLQQMGVCVAGFRWIKQADGYCCAGGAHWVPNGALGL